MANRSDFTFEEWDLLDDLPYLVGLSVSKADYSSTSYSKEFMALCDACREAKERYESNELLMSILSETMPEDSDDVTKEQLRMEELFEIFGKAVILIDRKCTAEEARQFKEFMYWLAQRVADASREGFLNLGKLVSDKEAEHLEKLKRTFGLSVSVS
jgi:hypothetical protein